MISKTKFGIYGGQFIHEILRMVPMRVDHKLKPHIAKNKI
jgi:tryptophan synthase beta subunit